MPASAQSLLLLFSLSLPSLSLSLSVFPSLAASLAGDDKVVINTPWWPAGTERSAESVGILSRGEVFMTGMMEFNSTTQAQVTQEIEDVSDIAVGGKTDLDHVTSCLIHTKKAGTSASVRALFEAALAPHGGAALSVQEMPGEYSGASTSISCRGVQPSVGAKTVVKGTGANDVAVHAGDLVHVAVEGASVESAVNASGSLLAQVTNQLKLAQTPVLVDCVVVLRSIKDAPLARSALNSSSVAHAPALTVIQGGLTAGANAALHCVASVTPITSATTVPNKGNSSDAPVPYAVTAGDFVYAGGISASMVNGTDGLATLSKLFHSAGTSLHETLDCWFYVKTLDDIKPLFEGFFLVFNVLNFPPPARTEFTANSEDHDGQVLIKCIAAVPAK